MKIIICHTSIWTWTRTSNNFQYIKSSKLRIPLWKGSFIGLTSLSISEVNIHASIIIAFDRPIFPYEWFRIYWRLRHSWKFGQSSGEPGPLSPTHSALPRSHCHGASTLFCYCKYFATSLFSNIACKFVFKS